MPILVGGCGLYVSSVVYDFRFPGTDAAIRARLEKPSSTSTGPGCCHARLPSRGSGGRRARSGRSNGRRLVRALEVIELTGAPFGAGLPRGPALWRETIVDRPARRPRRAGRAARRARRRRCGARPARRGRSAAARRLRRHRGPGDRLRAGARAAGRRPRRGRRWSRPRRSRAATRGARWAGSAAQLSRDAAWLDAERPARGRPAHRDVLRYAARVMRCRHCSFTKGHGTGNDFVLFADPDGAVELTDAQVAAICDRHFGVGADGVLRAVRSRDVEARQRCAEDPAPSGSWTTTTPTAPRGDVRQRHPGVRAFLIENGLAELAEGDTLPIGTRGGVHAVTRIDGGYEVDLGPCARRHRAAGARPASCRSRARASASASATRTSSSRSPTTDELEALDLQHVPTSIPSRRTAPTSSSSCRPIRSSSTASGSIRMRVHERGSGETLSCGTGAAAAALATRDWAGDGAPDRWRVEVPGGVVGVRVADGDHVLLVADPPSWSSTGAARRSRQLDRLGHPGAERCRTRSTR